MEAKGRCGAARIVQLRSIVPHIAQIPEQDSISDVGYQYSGILQREVRANALQCCSPCANTRFARNCRTRQLTTDVASAATFPNAEPTVSAADINGGFPGGCSVCARVSSSAQN